jgi:hypothetical protein
MVLLVKDHSLVVVHRVASAVPAAHTSKNDMKNRILLRDAMPMRWQRTAQSRFEIAVFKLRRKVPPKHQPSQTECVSRCIG